MAWAWQFPFLAMNNTNLLLVFHQLLPTPNPAPHLLGGVTGHSTLHFQQPLALPVGWSRCFFGGLLREGGTYYKHFNLLQRCLMPQCVVKFSWYAETWCTPAFPAQLLIPIVLFLHKEGGCFLTGYCKHIARTSHNSSTPDNQSRGSWSVVYLGANGWRGAWATLSLLCGCLGCFLQQRNLVHT